MLRLFLLFLYNYPCLRQLCLSLCLCPTGGGTLEVGESYASGGSILVVAYNYVGFVSLFELIMLLNFP